MSRALRLVVTQKEVSAFLKLSKNTAECAQWYSVQKQYGVRSGVEKSMSYGHVEMKDAANMNSFRLMRMQKIVRSKMLSLYRRGLYKNWFARFGSKVRKMNDQN